MALLWILRIALYVQLLLGLAKYFGPSVGIDLNQRIWEIHISLGILIALLALYALRPISKVRYTTTRAAARFAPLLPLVLGLGFEFHLIPTGRVVIIHMVLGVLTIGLVEMAAARQKRLLASRFNFK